jgi:hypothetical protein
MPLPEKASRRPLLVSIFLTLLCLGWAFAGIINLLAPSHEARGIRYGFSIFSEVRPYPWIEAKMVDDQGQSHDFFFGHDRKFSGEGLLREQYFLAAVSQSPASPLAKDFFSRWCRKLSPARPVRAELQLVNPRSREARLQAIELPCGKQP